ncbi:MAG: S8 family serine peptidase [Jejuia sp.]
MRNKILLIILALLSYAALYAQEEAWVYFVDKDNVLEALTNPLTILTQRAIDRKNRHNITIDSRDVPVNENYIAQIKAISGITVKAKSKWFNAVHVRGAQSDIENLDNLNFVSHVEFADRSLNQDKNATSRQYSKTGTVITAFNYGNAANQIEMLNGDELHLLNYTGEGMQVAILDSGFPNVNTIGAFSRVRDAGHILGSYDFVNRDVDVYTNTTSRHGTLVFSDMAGFIQDEFVGTAPDASYYLFITEDATSETPVEESYWVEAAERADSLGVDIINTSLGYSDFDGTKYDYTQADMNGQTAFITKGANIAFEKGMLLVTSAGNSGNWGVTAPADSPNVLSIGAVDASGNYATFSSVGTTYQPSQKPDVVAQGQLSYVITENNVIGAANGTSFSAPILAGGITCLWQALPDKTNAEIMQLVRTSASQSDTPDNLLGHGIPDLELALDNALSLTNISNTAEVFKVFPNPVKNELSISFPAETDTCVLKVFNVLGKFTGEYKISRQNPKIDVSSLSSGVYMIEISSGKATKYFKILKQ